MGKTGDQNKSTVNGYAATHLREDTIEEKSETTNCFAFYTKLPKSESFHKMQLTLLNSGFMSIKTEETDSTVNSLIPQTRMELPKFRRYVQEVRKYDVLVKIEYQVIKFISYSTIKPNDCLYLAHLLV